MKRSWFARHKILTAFGILLILAFLGNLGKQRKGHTASGTTDQVQTTPIDEPDIVISALDLSEAFKENEVRANQTYKGKLAEIHGEVFRVHEIFGRAVITLKGAPWAPGVSCVFHDEAISDRIAALDAGSVVTLRGTISGKSLSVDVKKCTFK